jgi:threonine/homoserine/homoserine lactone efflux protein
MNKITLQGVTIGTVVSAISALFVILFHKSIPVEVVALLPVAVGAVAHYLGINFAAARALKKDINNQPPAPTPAPEPAPAA